LEIIISTFERDFMKLVARFDVNLQGGSFLFKRPRTDDLCYKTTISDFDVELCLNLDVKSYRAMEKRGHSETSTDDYWTTSKVRIYSARNEEITPPLPQTINGQMNYEEKVCVFQRTQTRLSASSMGNVEPSHAIFQIPSS
jgi:hypothetical protein